MESTEQKRVWHSGPPPHVGWWNASVGENPRVWRWWDGICWSAAISKQSETWRIEWAVKTPVMQAQVEWNDYWPADARVPRLAPEDFEVGARWVCVNPRLLWEFRGLEFIVMEAREVGLQFDSYCGSVVMKFSCLPSEHYVPRRCVGPQTRWDLPMPKECRHG